MKSIILCLIFLLALCGANATSLRYAYFRTGPVTLSRDTVDVHINLYEDFRNQRYRILAPELNAFTLRSRLSIANIDFYQEYPLYEITAALYNKYYDNDLLLWNFKNAFLLSLNVKDLHNKRHLIKIEIPLSNFPHLFKRELWGLGSIQNKG